MAFHPDPAKKLFGFRVGYANGEVDYGLVVATSAETARLEVEAASFCTVECGIIIDDQPRFVDVIVGKYGGLAYLADGPSCN